MLPQLAKDYSSYLNVNVTEEMNPVQDVVDDLLTRLEETEAIISMIQKEQEQEDILPDLVECNESLKQMEVKVDKITAFLAHVARDVNNMQTKLINAEQDFPIHTNEGSFSSLFNKLIKSAESSPASCSRLPNSTYEPPEIFHTQDFFPSTLEVKTSDSP